VGKQWTPGSYTQKVVEGGFLGLREKMKKPVLSHNPGVPVVLPEGPSSSRRHPLGGGKGGNNRIYLSGRKTFNLRGEWAPKKVREAGKNVVRWGGVL